MTMSQARGRLVAADGNFIVLFAETIDKMTDAITNLSPSIFAQADALDDLTQVGLMRTRWPQEIGENGDWQAGTNLAYMRELVEYWINHYNWRTHETAMNAFPQFPHDDRRYSRSISSM